MTHVAICADGIFPYSVGGMQRHTRNLVEALAVTHPDLRITVIHPHGDHMPLFANLANVSEVAVAPRPKTRPYLVECFELSKRMATHLREMPDAVIYSQGLAVWSGITDFESRLIINPHGLESFQAIGLKNKLIGIPFRLIFSYLFRHARRVVSLGGRLTDILSQRVPDSVRTVLVLPNGVIPPAHPAGPIARGDTDGPLRLLFVGRFTANKGIPDLLKAMQVLAGRGLSQDFALTLAGSGPLLEPLAKAWAAPNISFTGAVDDATLARLYRESDAFVLPTLFEGMPTVVLEAMAFGLPILVTDVGATRELVDESNGFIIPRRNPTAIADRLQELRRLTRGQLSALGAASLRKVSERFTWTRVADAHYALFRSLAQ